MSALGRTTTLAPGRIADLAKGRWGWKADVAFVKTGNQYCLMDMPELPSGYVVESL